MKIKKLSVAVSAALVVAYLPAHGEDEGLGGAPEVKLRGFGTIGVVRNTNSNLDYIDNLSQPSGAGHTHKWDFGVDTKLAVQADAKFNEKLSASFQVMSQRQIDDTYRPAFEMAFGKWQLTQDTAVRIGRIPATLFMVSDYRKVGYVNPWVRQPNEVYFQVPYSAFDGGDISYQFSKGDFTGNISLAGGPTRKQSVQNEGDINTLRGNNAFSLNLTGEYGPVTIRLGHSQVKNTYTGESLNALYGGLSTIASYGNDTANVGTGKWQNNRGLPGMIYNRVYASAIEAAKADPAFQANFASLQAQSPNLSADSINNLILTSGDPKIAAGLAQAQGAATIAAGTYYAATAGASSLSDSSLKAQADNLYDNYAANKAMGTFDAIGLIIDPGTWMIQGEYTVRRTSSFIADSTGWYLTGGYRFGKFMPFISFSELKVDSPLDAPKLIDAQGQAALSAAAAGCAATYGAALGAKAATICGAGYGVTNTLSEGVEKTVRATSYGQKNVSLGMRWDFLKNAALKFQWDRIDMDGLPRGTPTNYIHTSPTGERVVLGTSDNYTDPATGKTYVTEVDKTKPVNVFSLAVDFVF